MHFSRATERKTGHEIAVQLHVTIIESQKVWISRSQYISKEFQKDLGPPNSNQGPKSNYLLIA